MPAAITALVALDAGVDEGTVRDVLTDTQGVEITAVLTDLEESWTALGEHASDVVIVACSPESEQVLPFIREASRQYPERPIIVLSGPSANGFVQHAFESGADDLVMSSLDEETHVVAGQLRFAVRPHWRRSSACWGRRAASARPSRARTSPSGWRSPAGAW